MSGDSGSDSHSQASPESHSQASPESSLSPRRGETWSGLEELRRREAGLESDWRILQEQGFAYRGIHALLTQSKITDPECATRLGQAARAQEAFLTGLDGMGDLAGSAPEVALAYRYGIITLESGTRSFQADAPLFLGMVMQCTPTIWTNPDNGQHGMVAGVDICGQPWRQLALDTAFKVVDMVEVFRPH